METERTAGWWYICIVFQKHLPLFGEPIVTVILTGSGHPRQGDTLQGPGLDASLKSVVIKNTSRETRTSVRYYLKAA